MRDSRRILAGVAGFILLGGSYAERAVAQAASETTGPYKIVMEMDASLPEHTVYRPEQVDSVKGKLPVVAYGNGACANAGNAFENYLAEVASYGFLVVANGPINPAAPGRPPKPGQPFPPFPAAPKGEKGARGPFQQSNTSQLYEAMKWGKVQNGKDGSRYKGKLDIAAVAVMGQSCGGLQALEAAGDPRVKTAVILNSGIIRNSGPLPEGAKGAEMRVPAAGLVLPGSPETLKKLVVRQKFIQFSLCDNALISVMEAAEFGYRDNNAMVHHLAFDRTLLAESQMGARPMVIKKVRR